MAPMLSLLFLLLFFLSPSSVSAGPTTHSTEFVRASCRATEYPALCFRSLARYADAVDGDPVGLARVAANVSYVRVRTLSWRVSALCRGGVVASLGRLGADALRDCASTLDSAADLAMRSAEELAMLGAATGPEVAWRVANAQTWMSAALTDEDTCDDGFERVGPGAVKDHVRRGVRAAMRLSSNALALVNSLVAGQP